MYKIKFTFPTPNATSWFKEGWKQFVKINWKVNGIVLFSLYIQIVTYIL
jgi:hypothetical protein